MSSFTSTGLSNYRVVGGNTLSGEVCISGAKNAALPILTATVLCDGICRLENLPAVADVTLTLEMLSVLGAQVKAVSPGTVEIDTRPLREHVVPNELARQNRASYYFLGALLGRCGVARVAMPGGCSIGSRPIDQHLKGFTALGGTVAPMDGGMIEVSAEKLTGSTIYLDRSSVGATANILLACVKAEGDTVIENAAKEPHIVDLANFLNFMGADVRGAGTDVIKVRGVSRLYGTTYSIIPDQIEAGTYMAAAVLTGGSVVVRNVIPKHLESISAKLEEMGAVIEEYDDAVRVTCTAPLHHCNVKTMPHPGFPTDMQPQIAVLLAVADGTSLLTEDIFDGRFRYIEELRRMGADVQVDGKVAVFQGVGQLKAAPVRALDLRAGAAMVLAALVAQGESEIEDIHHIERGYEDIVGKLRSLGADIRAVSAPPAAGTVRTVG